MYSTGTDIVRLGSIASRKESMASKLTLEHDPGVGFDQ